MRRRRQHPHGRPAEAGRLLAYAVRRMARAGGRGLRAATRDLLGRAAAFLAADRVAVFLHDAARREFREFTHWTPGGRPLSRPARVSSDPGGAFGWCAGRMLAGRPVVARTLAELPRGARAEREVFRRLGLRGVAMVPLFGGRRVLGVLALYATRARPAWDAGTIAMAQALGELIGQTIAAGEARASRQASERLFRALFHQIPEPMLLLKCSGGTLRVADFNPMFLARVQPGATRVIGHRLVDLMPSGDELLQAYLRVQRTGRPERHLNYVSASARVRRHYDVLITRLGRSHVLALGRDITRSHGVEARMMAIWNAEKRRISSELSDDVGQHLAALQYLGAALERALEQKHPEIAGRLVELNRRTMAATARAAALARRITPVEVTGDGLPAALSSLCRQTEHEGRQACAFVLEGGGRVTDIALASEVYTIARETVEGFTAGPRAARVRVTLELFRRNEGRLTVVREGGGGRSRSPRPDLAVLRYRADHIGASLRFETLARGGAAIVCRFPDVPARVPRMP